MNIVVLTGAGISAESGVPTFRDSGGTWHQHNVDDVSTPEGWARDPDLVHDFYNQRRLDLQTVESNAAHFALAKLEAQWTKGGFLIVTQNVDDLHERSGSKNVLHMHGELNSIRCENEACGAKRYERGSIHTNTRCLECGGTMRPDVVWFGEMPFESEFTQRVLDATDLLIVIGTSGEVMPANLFPSWTKRNGRNPRTIQVNLQPYSDNAFDEFRVGKATETVPLLVDEILAANR